jgi:hypothetical protein
MSDHGQKVSLEELEIHGNWHAPGNAGWVLFYSPYFEFSVSSTSAPATLNTGTYFFLILGPTS